jgi:hypothetical protein
LRCRGAILKCRVDIDEVVQPDVDPSRSPHSNATLLRGERVPALGVLGIPQIRDGSARSVSVDVEGAGARRKSNADSLPASECLFQIGTLRGSGKPILIPL